MHKIIHNFVWLVIVVFVSGSAFAATRTSGGSVPGEVLVKIQANASNADLGQIELQADADQDTRVSDVGSGVIWRIHSRSKTTDQLISTLRNHPKVVYAEPNYIVHAIATPNDPSYGQLWGLKNTGQTISERLRMLLRQPHRNGRQGHQRRGGVERDHRIALHHRRRG